MIWKRDLIRSSWGLNGFKCDMNHFKLCPGFYRKPVRRSKVSLSHTGLLTHVFKSCFSADVICFFLICATLKLITSQTLSHSWIMWMLHRLLRDFYSPRGEQQLHPRHSRSAAGATTLRRIILGFGLGQRNGSGCNTSPPYCLFSFNILFTLQSESQWSWQEKQVDKIMLFLPGGVKHGQTLDK